MLKKLSPVFVMVKILLSDTVTGMSGKIAGNVYAKNRYGAYKRNKGVTINPSTPSQIAVRAAFSFLSQLWRALTFTQRDGWNDLANSGDVVVTDVFGNAIKLSGFNLFKRFNQNLSTIGGEPIEDAPVLGAGPSGVDMVSEDSTLDVGDEELTGVSLTIANDAPGAGALTLVIEATPPVSAGRASGSVGNLYRIISAVTLIAAAATMEVIDDPDAAVYAAYVAVFGTPALGKKIFFRAKVIQNNTGQETIVGAWTTVTADAP